MLEEKINQGCQFIIATCSPILLPFPDAQIWNFDTYSIKNFSCKDVEHVAITKAFLNDPESYLRYL